MTVLKMTDLDLAGKRVLIREDLNVPVKDGAVKSDARILASLPTIKLALEKGAAVLVCSHLGRPEEGIYSEEDSLKPVADYLSKALGREVPLVKDYLDGVEVKPGELVLLENVRFNKGEKKNTDELAQKYAALCDVFVMDAFGTAHRAQGSTHGVAKFAKVACAGPLLAAELEALGKALDKPARPMVAIVAGSKVSTKLDVLTSLADICDQLIVGGGIANTFLAAAGYKVGKSLHEADLLDTAKAIAAKVAVPLPVDVVVAKEFAESAEATVKAIADVADDDMILDIGPKTAAMFAKCSRLRRPSSGTARSACSSSTSSATAPRCWPKPSPRARHSPSPVAATPWRPSTSTAWPSRSPISPPAVAPSSSSSRARCCRPWKCWSSAAPSNLGDLSGGPRLARQATAWQPRPAPVVCVVSDTRKGDAPCAMPFWLFAVWGWLVVPATHRIPPVKCSSRRRRAVPRPNATSVSRCRPPAIRR